MLSKNVGQSNIQWEVSNPFAFTISEEVGARDDARVRTIRCDLSVLVTGYTDRFLLELKELIVQRKHSVSLETIAKTSARLVRLLRSVMSHKVFDKKVDYIDENFLLALSTISEHISKDECDDLKRMYKFNAESDLFSPNVRIDYFPETQTKKGGHGDRIDHILTTALTRQACAEILSQSEQAFEDGQMDIGCFAFINLAFSVFARVDGYRRIQLKDLVCNNEDGTFFIYISPSKTRVRHPRKICYQVNPNVGILLQKQRQSVIEKYGHLVGSSEIGKMALFPAARIRSDNSGWVSKYSNKNQGQLQNTGSFVGTYIDKTRKLIKASDGCLTMNALRHTIGTQLAASGCSSRTIMAVLKHASPRTANAYVDIAFHGLVNALSDSLKSTFQLNFPAHQIFCSNKDVTSISKAIYSENIDTGHTALTGECGKTIQCQAAPLACYECNKFIPCYDADHSVNLEIVDQEIRAYEDAGCAYQHLLKKAKNIKHRIIQVMAMCVKYDPLVQRD